MRQPGFSDVRPEWHLRRTGFPAAWHLATGRTHRGRATRIAVLDSGVDLAHPALQGLLGEGVNLLEPDSPPMDEHGHGTHVTGIIAAAAGAWWLPAACTPISIHPVKIFDKSGFGSIANIVRGLNWCIENQMDLINLSFGTDQKTSTALERAVLEVENASILMVAAAGNDGRKGDVDFPGRLPSVVAVAASTRSDRLAPFSSSGTAVDILAPGANVLSLKPGGKFARMSGTSMAAPHASAAAAILMALQPHLTPAGVRRLLRSSAEWISGLPPQAQGAGMLRVDQLLRSRA